MSKLSLMFLVVIVGVNLQAVTIKELFDSIRKQPATKIDAINEKMAEVAKQKVMSSKYPVVDMFASYTHYNSPTNLIPLDPQEAGILIAKKEPLPFATTIEKFGVKVSIPLFVKEIEYYAKRAELLAKGAKYKKSLNFYKNEAVVLGANAVLEYLDSLLLALNSTKKSILKTKSDIQIAVQNGRMPGIAIDKIDEKLNQLEITINSVKIKENGLISKIETLTGIKIDKAVPISLKKELQKGEIYALKPLKASIEASFKDLEATKAKRYYPKVGLNLLWSENYSGSDSYLSKSVHRGYGYYQLGISMPLYNKSEDTQIEIKKIALMKERMKYKKSENELSIEAKSIEEELNLLYRSLKLSKENIKKRDALLAYAKVAFKEGRMSEEDYLRYEDLLLNAKANYYQVVSQKWQDIAKLAVIWGEDLRKVVK